MEKSRGKKKGEGHIPNKLYFRIGEVSDIVGVKPYVLRYWESEFTDIKPSKSKSGQRLYKKRDVEMLVRIKELLYKERFTIGGAKKRLKDGGKGDGSETDASPAARGPKQLEVFADADDETTLKAASKGDNKKVLTKIKKDLQAILEVVKG